MTANSSPPSQAQPTWYYALDGRVLGPIDDASMALLIAKGTVTAQTMVWQQGMGDWAPAGQTSLRSLLGNVGAAPPPLSGEHVDNTIAWTIAFMPLLFPFITAMLGHALGGSASSLWLVPAVINTVLCIADERRLKNAGYGTGSMFFWAIFLVPAYLFMRASRLKQSNAYAFVWLATFVVSLFI